MNTRLPLLMVLSVFGFTANAQQLELASGSGPSSTGPTTTPGASTFFLNTTGNTFASFSPATTVTLTFSQNYSTSATVAGIVAGGRSTGATTTTLGSGNVLQDLGDIGSPSNGQYTSDPFGTAGTGIDVTTNYGIQLATDVTYLSGQPLNSRYDYGTITLTFSQPVVNPVLHIAGIGGRTFTTVNNGNPTNNLGYYTEFELPANSPLTLTELSGSTFFNVTSNAILNSSTSPSTIQPGTFYTTQTAGNNGSGGSVRVNTGSAPITSLTLRVFLRSDAGVGTQNNYIDNIGNIGLNERQADAYVLSVSLGANTLSGNVFNDIDGLNNGGFVNASGTSNPLPTGLFANLVNSAGTIVASQAIPTTGVNAGQYSFDDILGGNYRVVLTTSATSTTAALPAGWQNTGQFLGAPTTAGNDGTPADGTLGTVAAPIAVGTTAANTTVSNANFGIQQPPTAGSGIVSNVPNPGGIGEYTVTNANWTNTNVSSDPTPGAVTNIRITGLPTGATSIRIGGTLYNAANPIPVGGVLVPTSPTGQPAIPITVDPANDGVTQVSIPFVAVDAAGASSTNTGAQGTAVINFIDLTISGTVYNDANGLANSGVIDGTPINNAGGQLYATLIQTSDAGTSITPIVRASVAIAANGTYSFGNADGVRSNSGYVIRLGNVQGIANSTTLPSTTLVAPWVNTGDGQGGTSGDNSPDGRQLVNVTTSSITLRDFGIERTPESQNISYQLTAQSPNVFVTVGQVFVLNGTGPNTGGVGTNPPLLKGSDPEDYNVSPNATLAGKTVRIVSLPTRGQLLYGSNNTVVTAGQTITNYDPSLLKYTPTAAGIGFNSDQFTYAYVDIAGIADPSPATYTLNFGNPLPVEIARFDAAAQGCNAKLSWQSGVEDPGSRYEVQYSRTGEASDFVTIATVAGKGSNSSYEGMYAQASGTGYYRLRTTDASAEVAYSATRTVRTSCGGTAVSLYPNPTTGTVTLEGVSAGAQIRVFDGGGRLVIATVAAGTVHQVDLGAQAAGTYHVAVATEGAQPQSFQVVKR